MGSSHHSILLILGFFFGVTAKYADLVNEHGLKPYFKGSSILSGFLWGSAGIGIFFLSPLTGITYMAHILYWFQRVKLDYPNHALAGVMFLLGGMFFLGDFIFQHRVDLLLLYVAYCLSGYLQSYCKERFKASYWFWRLRLRIYLIPLVYSLYCWDFYPFVTTVVGMIGCEIMTFIYREYREEINQTYRT